MSIIKHLLFPDWRPCLHQGIPETQLFWTVSLCACPSQRHPSASPETPAAANATHEWSYTHIHTQQYSSTQFQRRCVSSLVTKKLTNKAKGPLPLFAWRVWIKYNFLIIKAEWGMIEDEVALQQKGERKMRWNCGDSEWNAKQNTAGAVIARRLFPPPFHWLHFKQFDFMESRTCRV